MQSFLAQPKCRTCHPRSTISTNPVGRAETPLPVAACRRPRAACRRPRAACHQPKAACRRPSAAGSNTRSTGQRPRSDRSRRRHRGALCVRYRARARTFPPTTGRGPSFSDSEDESIDRSPALVRRHSRGERACLRVCHRTLPPPPAAGEGRPPPGKKGTSVASGKARAGAAGAAGAALTIGVGHVFLLQGGALACMRAPSASGRRPACAAAPPARRLRIQADGTKQGWSIAPRPR